MASTSVDVVTVLCCKLYSCAIMHGYYTSIYGALKSARMELTDIGSCHVHTEHQRSPHQGHWLSACRHCHQHDNIGYQHVEFDIVTWTMDIGDHHMARPPGLP